MKNNALNRALFILLLSSFIGIVFNPEILAASDTVGIMDLDSSHIVKTVEIKKPKKVDKTEEEVFNINALETKTSERPIVSTPVVENYVALGDKVSFSWGDQNLTSVSSTAENAGANIAQVGKLMYGHNYTAFGDIVKLQIGDSFMVTKNGTTIKYRVAASPITGAAGVILEKKGESILSYAGDKQYDVIDVNALISYGMGHSLALMTCYGENSRYVVVADAI